VPELEKKRVLVVDDVEANRSVVCRRLERLNYVMSAADSGESALRLIDQQTFDIILLDYMMPDMNGIDVLRELRTNSRAGDVPIIMLTARADAQTVVASLEAGADDYVSKPIDFDVLAARIEAQLLRRRQAHNLKVANAALDERVTRRTMEMSELEEALELEVRQRRILQQELERLVVEREVGRSKGLRDVRDPLARIAELAELLAASEDRVSSLPPEAISEIAKLARQALVATS
jgi:DNA-binding response OmpR family regulator